MADAKSARLPVGKMPPSDASALFLKAMLSFHTMQSWQDVSYKNKNTHHENGG
jgi:hypothetical protein